MEQASWYVLSLWVLVSVGAGETDSSWWDGLTLPCSPSGKYAEIRACHFTRCASKRVFIPSVPISICPAPSLQVHTTTTQYRSHTTANMSSPASRRSTRSSANNTPQQRRTQQRASQNPRSSEPPMSDPPLPDADMANSQLQSEANAASQQGTPRASQNSQSQSQAPPTSSPLFFRSSPTGSQSQSQSQGLGVPAAANGVGSSPLRQRVDAGTPGVLSSEGGRTPRANGGIGGEFAI